MTKRLHYFDINGRAEGIRYLLHYANIEFEDVRRDHEKWSTIKTDFPFGQLPVYEEGGRRITQSVAIAQYLGQTNNLIIGDSWRDAELFAVAVTLDDFFNRLAVILRSKDDAAVNESSIDDIVVFFLSRFEKQLKQNEGFFGGKLTWVDFVFVGLIEAINLYVEFRMETKYPAIEALIAKIHSYPGVQRYTSSRKPYTKPLQLK